MSHRHVFEIGNGSELGFFPPLEYNWTKDGYDGILHFNCRDCMTEFFVKPRLEAIMKHEESEPG